MTEEITSSLTFHCTVFSQNHFDFSWANVNPEVPHPRWSQASEQVLGTGERIDTQIFNGYREFVASLYAGLENENLYT